jgi:hypothetical protein
MKKLICIMVLGLFGGVASAISAETYLVCSENKSQIHVVFDDSSGFEKWKLNKTYKQFDFDR